jgi:hypothetical protein
MPAKRLSLGATLIKRSEQRQPPQLRQAVAQTPEWAVTRPCGTRNAHAFRYKERGAFRRPYRPGGAVVLNPFEPAMLCSVGALPENSSRRS